MKKIISAVFVLLLGFILIGTASAALNDGLIAYYHLQPVMLTTRAETETTELFMAQPLPKIDNGNPNSAYSFDGINNYIYIPWNSNLDARNFTISAWFKPFQLSNPSGTIIARLWNGQDQYSVCRFYFASSI